MINIDKFSLNLNKFLLAWLIIVMLFNSLALAQIAANNPQKKVVKILAIDGGGIRGIIPALILKNLEARLTNNKQLVDCFDIVSGTSTGGIIALLLTTPNKDNKPKYNISQVLELYKELGSEVFQRSIFKKITTGWGWWGAKYSEDKLMNIFEKYFGIVELKDTIKPVIIPAYEIEMDKTFFFKSTRAKTQANYNYQLKDIARATSAAPTYFTPAQIQDLTKKEQHILIDGGVAVNNLTLAATVYGLELYGKDQQFFIVSLGTGTSYGAKTKLIDRSSVQDSGLLGWAKKISSLMMYAVNDVTDYEMRYVFNHHDYYRFQPIIEISNAELDDSSTSNIAALYKYAEDYINTNDEIIQQVADYLNN